MIYFRRYPGIKIHQQAALSTFIINCTHLLANKEEPLVARAMAFRMNTL